MQYHWSLSSEVMIGEIALGGRNPIRVQTMTNTTTSDTSSTVNQIIRCAEAGADFVRIAVPSVKEAENLFKIKNELLRLNYNIPIVADVHFHPKLAEISAQAVEKVRINPGNYSEKKGKFTFSDQEYEDAISQTRDRFFPLLELCRKRNTALRIGTNHGSLSERIVSRYGHTAEGLVEACLEFLRLCREFDFIQVVVSIKASNPRLMVQANRLLFHRMRSEGFNFPIHLGVTEAGAGEDGRLKSAVGIGALLLDGIGDTIRVSLTEPPEAEIPVAKQLARAARKSESWNNWVNAPGSPFGFEKMQTTEILNIGSDRNTAVISSGKFNFSKQQIPDLIKKQNGKFISLNSTFSNNSEGIQLITKPEELNAISASESHYALIVTSENEDSNTIELIKKASLLVFETEKQLPDSIRRQAWQLRRNDNVQPFIIKIKAKYFRKNNSETWMSVAGFLLIDGLFDAIWLDESDSEFLNEANKMAFNILQSCGLRISRADIISCPSCGRTGFDIVRVAEEVKTATEHLLGLKIAVMGCIVNGPGEMADADYAYIGTGNGKVNLYRKQKLIESGVEEVNALERLIHLIKSFGDWLEAENEDILN